MKDAHAVALVAAIMLAADRVQSDTPLGAPANPDHAPLSVGHAVELAAAVLRVAQRTVGLGGDA